MTEEMVDPVSKNEIPPNVDAENVRDDIPIKASEGEYILSADVVRFLGLEKIESLVAKAKQGIADAEEAGHVGGEALPEDELPFDPAELEAMDVADPQIQEFAEGGVVKGDGKEKQSSFTGIKTFKDANGRVMYIPFLYGEPVSEVPQGYSEDTPEAVTPEAPDPNKNVDSARPPLTTGQETPQSERNTTVSPLAGSPSAWKVDDFLDFSKQRGGPEEKAIQGILMGMPLGGMAVKARTSYLDRTTAELMDGMLETGVDLQGQPIPDDKKVMLSASREQLKTQMSNQTGLNLGPMEKLSSAFEQFVNWTGGKLTGQPTAAPPVTASSRNAPTGAPRSAMPNYEQDYGAGASDNHNQYGGGSYGAGSDLGRDPSKGPSEGSMASGGLYSKGGLVTRRKK